MKSSLSHRPLARRLLSMLFLAALLLLPTFALARPRSGASFGGRTGFRSRGGYSMPRTQYRTTPGSSGPSFFFFPGFGWGWGGMGFGGGLGSLVVLGVVGIAAVSLIRAARRQREAGMGPWGSHGDDDGEVMPERAYVYRLQVALGRSARGIQDRLARFAAEGDTSTENGLASLLQQTALELLREKDAIRYAGADAAGPMSYTNAETRLGSLSLAERSRFQVERVRGAEGQVRRSDAVAEEGKEALELVVVTVVAATRTPIAGWKALSTRAELDALLSQLGSVPASAMLGLEVVWTPADPNDSMTEVDVMTTYPELRGVD